MKQKRGDFFVFFNKKQTKNHRTLRYKKRIKLKLRRNHHHCRTDDAPI